MGERTKVFHIPGRFTHEAPLEDHTVESKSEADRLVGTGAFALSQKDANAQAFTTPEATPATDENVVADERQAAEAEPAAPADTAPAAAEE